MNVQKQNVVMVLFDTFGAYQENSFKQIRSVLEPEGIGVLMAIGRELQPSETYYEGINHIYSLIRQVNVKGFIIGSASIGHNVSYDVLSHFVKSFTSVPVVSLGTTIEGIASVVPDNRVGMKAMMKHLLETRELDDGLDI